jgi:iron complex outermembrane receptor protein
MRLKHVILVLAFSVLFVNAINSQDISGVVKNIDTQKPIIGANVFIPELQKGTSTDIDGKFQLSNLPKSQLRIDITHIGYKTVSKSVNLTTDSLNRLEVYMEPTVIHSDAVVISAGTYSTQHKNAIKIETLKSSDFQQIDAPTLTAKLAKVPGVDMITKGNGITKPVIRGLSNSNILVLNNGVKMENFQFSENHPFMIDEFGVDRVEVIKGPASLLYGSDAVGGIINVIGEKPASTRTLEAEIIQEYHTNTNGSQTNVGVKQTYDDFFWGIRSGFKTHQDYRAGSDHFVPNSRFNNLGLHAFTGLNKSFGSFRLYYDYTQMKLGMTVPGIDSLVKMGERENDVWYQNLDNHLLISKNKFFMGDFKLETDFSYQQNDRKLQVVDKNAVNMQMKTYTADLRSTYSLNKATDIVIGWQGRQKENVNNDAPNHVLPDHTVTDMAFHGLLQHDISKDLRLQAGMRWDYRIIDVPKQKKSGKSNANELDAFSENYDNVSYSMGATYHISSTVLLRSNFASAYRTPNVAELMQEGVHGARYEEGNRNLKSQKNYEGDLSLHYHCCHAMLDVSGFYNSISDYIYLAPTGNTTAENLPIYQYEQTNARLYGGELNFEIRPVEWFKGMFDYSMVIGERSDGSNLPFIPHDKINAGIRLQGESASWFHNPFIKISSTYALTQDNPSRFETETPDYFLMDLKLGGKLVLFEQKLDVSVSAQNLFNVQYIDHLSTLKPLDYSNMGRNIIFTLQLPLNTKF